jgi:hypothetical protein
MTKKKKKDACCSHRICTYPFRCQRMRTHATTRSVWVYVAYGAMHARWPKRENNRHWESWEEHGSASACSIFCSRDWSRHQTPRWRMRFKRMFCMFHSDVACVLSGRCICCNDYIHMLQNVSSKCFSCFIWMLHMLLWLYAYVVSVCSKCFIDICCKYFI